MSDEAFVISGKITADSGEAEKALDSTVDKAKSTSGKLSTIFKAIGTASIAAITGASAAIGVLGKKSITAYAEFEQLIGGSELLFGEAFDYIADKAKNAYSTVQMSQSEYLQQVNGFATGLKTALGGNADEAAILADRIVTAEADVIAATGNSAEAVQNAFNGIMKGNFTMLDNLQLGITPTKEGFQTLIDQVNKWNKANGNNTKYSIKNLADCQNALIDYIEMQGLSGYAAMEASTTISGSLASVSGAWDNLMTGLSGNSEDIEGLIDNLVTTIAGDGSDSNPGLIGNILPRIGNVFNGIPKLISGLAPKIPEVIQQIIPGLLTGVMALITGVANALPTFMNIVVGMIPELINTVIPALVSATGTIISAIANALPVAIQAILNLIPSVLTRIADFVKTNVPILIQSTFGIISTIANSIIEFLPVIIDMIPGLLESILTGILESVPLLLNGVSELLVKIADSLPGLIEHIVNIIPSLITIILNAIIGNLPAIVNGFVTLFTVLVQHMPEILAIIIQAMPEMIETVVQALIENFPLFVEAFKLLFDLIVSASEEMIEAVINGFTTYVNAIIGYAERIYTQLSAIWENIKSAVSNKVTEIKNAAVSKFEEIKSNVEEKIEGVRSAVSEKFEAIKSLITDPIETAKETVRTAVEAIKGFFEGLEIKFPELKLPHFKIEGELSLNPPKVPTLSVDWYSKAMNNPMILNSPTIFGVGSNGSLLGGGEAGSEVVAGTNTLLNMIQSAIRSEIGNRSGNTVNLYAQTIDDSTIDYIYQKLNARMGVG